MPEKTPEQIVNEAVTELRSTVEANDRKRDSLFDDKMNKINDTLDRFEAQNKEVTTALANQKNMQSQVDNIEAIVNRINLSGGSNVTEEQKQRAEYKAAIERVLRQPAESRDVKDMTLINNYRNTLTRGDDPGAGYLAAPPEMVAEIIKDIVQISPMRSLATVRTIGSASLKQPKRTGTARATRVGEQGKRANTGDPAYGMVEFPAHELFARAEISQQMLEDMDYDLVAELRSEFVEQFALTEGIEFVVGTGTNNQAAGLVVNVDIEQIHSGAAATVTADGMINLFYGLKTGYLPGAQWIMNRQTIRDIRKLKDGDGNYLWMVGIPGATPNTILGATYVEMPAMPDIGAGTFPVAFGDYKRAYTVVDRVQMSFQADFITGADQGVVVYRARKRVGGGVRQADAVKKLLIAA